jgi:hypothetical protein
VCFSRPVRFVSRSSGQRRRTQARFRLSVCNRVGHESPDTLGHVGRSDFALSTAQWNLVDCCRGGLFQPNKDWWMLYAFLSHEELAIDDLLSGAGPRAGHDMRSEA